MSVFLMKQNFLRFYILHPMLQHSTFLHDNLIKQKLYFEKPQANQQHVIIVSYKVQYMY